MDDNNQFTNPKGFLEMVKVAWRWAESLNHEKCRKEIENLQKPNLMSAANISKTNW